MNPTVAVGRTYDDYAPAYRLGYNSWSQYGGELRRVRESSRKRVGQGQRRVALNAARGETGNAGGMESRRAQPVT